MTFRKLAGNSQTKQGMALPSSEATIVTATSTLVRTLNLTFVRFIFSKAEKVHFLALRGSNGAARRVPG
jgi:hypothetical protein